MYRYRGSPSTGVHDGAFRPAQPGSMYVQAHSCMYKYSMMYLQGSFRLCNLREYITTYIRPSNLLFFLGHVPGMQKISEGFCWCIDDQNLIYYCSYARSVSSYVSVHSNVFPPPECREVPSPVLPGTYVAYLTCVLRVRAWPAHRRLLLPLV